MFRANKAFTLAEVLIALALLGVIAAFAIPKVLQSVADAEQKTKSKANLAALSQIMHEAYLNNNWPKTSAAIDQLLKTKLNVLYSTGPTPSPGDGLMDSVYYLEDGSTIRLHCNLTLPLFNIDYNGDGEPNAALQDRLLVFGNATGSTVCGIKPGAVGPVVPSECNTLPGSPTSNSTLFFNHYLKIMATP